MSTQISIGPVSENENTEIKLLFGSNISASSIIDFVKRDTTLREGCGLITDNEANEMVKQAEEKIRLLSLP